jgi:hypothetical protein
MAIALVDTNVMQRLDILFMLGSHKIRISATNPRAAKGKRLLNCFEVHVDRIEARHSIAPDRLVALNERGSNTHGISLLTAGSAPIKVFSPFSEVGRPTG